MSPREQLSYAEIRIATLVWQGQTNPQIAQAVGTTEQVIKNHLRAIFDKLGVWSRLELALYVASHGGERWADVLPAYSAPKAVTNAAFVSVASSN